MKTHTFHVEGMHCNSCVVLIERSLGDLPEVSRVHASLGHLRVEVSGEFGDKDPAHIARDLSEVLKPHGYSLVLARPRHRISWSEFYVALPVAFTFVLGFVALQKLGIVNVISSPEVTYGTAFLVGIVASVSTCMAVVGGLVLSMSASFAKEGERLRPQILFHIGRLASFFILGGLIGVLGSALQLSANGMLVLSFLVAVVLIVLGFNLLDVVPGIKHLQITTPRFLSSYVHRLADFNHTLTPFLLGIATFFLPCGFTQSMQIYTLTTGSFVEGALTMFVFALGTLPVLALLSFSSFAIQKKAQSGIFFKTAGLVVLFFGVFNLINVLVVLGVIPPLYNL